MNKRRYSFLLVLLALLLAFWGLGSHGLIDPDEGRYAEIPREMLESGDFVTPRLNYVKYFEKPVLHYWLTAVSFAVLGLNEFAARLVPAIAGLGGAALVFALARRRWSFSAALYAAAVLSTSLLWFAIARLNIIDMTLTFFMTLSLTGFWLSLRDGEPSRSGTCERRWLLLFYAGMALATLSKGLIGIVLPGGVVFWFMVLSRRWRLLPYLLYLPGIGIFFLLTVPWFWAVCRANDDFFYFFFIQEHFLRYTTDMHERYEPFWYFVPILIAGSIPWTGLLPDTLRRLLFRRKAAENVSFELFLALWFAVPFLFFSFSGSKLVPYILPCLPPLALAGGKLLEELAQGDRLLARRFAYLNVPLFFLLAAGGTAYLFLDKKLGAQFLLPYILPVVLSFGLLGLASLWLYRRGSYKLMVESFCVLAFFNALVLTRGFSLKAELDSRREAAAAILPLLGESDVVASYKDVAQGLSFYLGRRIVLVDVRGELEFGSRQEPDPRWFIDDAKLEALWKNEKGRVFLLADRKNEGKLQKILGEPPAVLRETRGETVFVNFGASLQDTL